MSTNMVQRSITGGLFALVLIGATLLSGISFTLLLFVVNLLCLYEFFLLVLPDKSKLETYLGIGAGSVIFGMFALILLQELSLAWYYHLIPVFLVLFIIKLFENTHREFETLAYQILGIVYISLPLTMLNKMGYWNSLSYSAGIPMGFLLLLWTADTGAYFTGKSFGKRKLFERISPKKTIEGSIGALLSVLIVGYFLPFVFDDLPTMHWMVIAAIVVVFSTFGDLFESLLKRNLHIKDSGNILPGHGGVLDRFDGLFLSVPAVFFYLMLIR